VKVSCPLRTEPSFDRILAVSGVGELDTQNLSELLELKYKSTVAGAEALGGVQKVREAFIGFQAGLYR